MTAKKPDKDQPDEIIFGDLGPDDEYVDPLETESGAFALEEPGEEEDTETDVEVAEERVEPEAPETPSGKEPDEDLRAIIASQQQEIERLRGTGGKELADAKKELFELKEKSVEGEITSVRAILRQAVEDGDADKQVEFQEKLADALGRKHALVAEKERASREPADRGQQELPQAAPQTAQARQWMTGKFWINNRAYVEANRDLLRISEAIYHDGYDPTSAEYYQEIERRMTRKYPQLFQAKPEKPSAKTRVVSPVSRDDAPRPSPNGSARRVVLTNEDKLNMRRFSLDPTNKDHLTRYAKEKAATDAAAR